MWAPIQEKDAPSNSRVGEKALSENGLNCGYHTCLLTSPSAFRDLLWSLYGPPKCWPKIKRLPVIFPAKMSLFGISREFKPHASPCTTGEGELFYRGEKEVGRAIVNKESMAFHWLSLCQKRSLFSCCWALFPVVDPSGLPALFNWGFCLLIFHKGKPEIMCLFFINIIWMGFYNLQLPSSYTLSF